MITKLRIVTRESALALKQTNLVVEEIKKINPEIEVTIIGKTTIGDKILDKALDKIGGKGLFIKELEQALLDGVADIAVHSLKDVPGEIDERFALVATLKREDPRDAFVSNRYGSLEEMPANSVIGTSSARRGAIIKHYYPHLQIKLLRGNVNTRLRKLDDHEYDGIILAAAGLKRLALDARIKTYLDASKFIPAIGQGAIVIQSTREMNFLEEFFSPINHQETQVCTACEREVGLLLDANCSVPVGVHASIVSDQIILQAMLTDSSGKFCSATVLGSEINYSHLAKECVEQLTSGANLSHLNKK